MLASPWLVAISVARVLQNAGWIGAEALHSASAFGGIEASSDDIVVLVECAPGLVLGKPTSEVVPAVRMAFPSVGIVVVSADRNADFTNDPRSRVMSCSTDITRLCREITHLSGNYPFAAPNLTRRHCDLLRLIAQGATTGEAGRALGISEKTATNHLSSAYQRLGSRNQTQAVLAASRAGLIDPGAH